MTRSNKTKSYRIKKSNKSRKKRGEKKDDCMKKIPQLFKTFLSETIKPKKRTLFKVRGCGTNMFGIKKLNQIDVGGLKKIFKDL